MKSRENKAPHLARRFFLKQTLAQCTGLLLAPPLAWSSPAANAKHVNACLLDAGKYTVQHQWTDSTARIEVQGLRQGLKVLHLSDTHVTCSDDTDLPFKQYSARMDRAYQQTRHYQTGVSSVPIEYLRRLLQFAQGEKVDFIVLTGDIVNNPSRTSVSAIVRELRNVNIPYAYVAGNHDWHYEGMTGTADQLRETWRKKHLRPLYPTDALSHYAAVRAGINFIAIDNSTYQVTEQQAAFFQAQMALGLPSVLLMHIPLSLGSFRSLQCGHPNWGSQRDRNYKIERRQRWPETGNFKSTMGFVRQVAQSNNLVAILCGHIHSARVDRVTPLAFPETTSPSALQYTTRAGAVGGHRLVTFKGA
jgi:predicted MPP superfamily phosphohydrolase